MKFVHLHTHSHYSLLDGLAKIDDLVLRAKSLEMDALALTDHGNLYGAIEFYKKARAAGIKPILGVEAYIAPGARTDRDATNGKYYHLILLAENNAGWQNLIQLVTKANLEGFYYKPRMDKELLKMHHEGLIALSGCYSGEVVRAILANRVDDAERIIKEYKEIFGENNFFIEIGNHPHFDPQNHKRVWPALIELSKKTNTPLVATQDIHYLRKEDAQYHDILLAVQTGNNVNDGDRLTFKDEDFSMRGSEEMKELFKEIPEAYEKTQEIADRCTVEIPLGKIQLPYFPVPDHKDSNKYLEELIHERTSSRYPKIDGTIKLRIQYELQVIEKTGFANYFLIVQDFVNWAKDHGIVVGPGRGSAAGSIISYILGITDVDPLKYDLLFERFLNPDRIQMPDIDIDFTDVRRDEVIGYLQEKYGTDRVARIITFGTMAARAAIRDVGRALGLNYGFCDQIAKLIPFQNNLEEALENVKELRAMYDTDLNAKRLIEAAKHLEGVARHASVHACGTVIGKNELTELVPLQRAPQDETLIITQFEMHAIEDLGLLKIDLLGLKNLSIIEDAIRLIEETGKKIDIHHLPEKDAKTFALFASAETVGVFQLESAGMRRYLKDLKPTDLEDVIALIALFRPGPIELIPTYIARKQGLQDVTYLHPKLEPILDKTHGIAIYQEQLMQIARDLGGFTLGEADILRKAVGKKIKSLLDEQRDKLIKGMIKNDIPTKTAQAIWAWFEPFARYGFNRSHAVAYALISYQTAYLKAHYPVEFMTSFMNSDSKDIERLSFIMSEAKHMSIAVLPPDINKSFARFTPDDANIRFGLDAIKNVGENIVNAIIEERAKNGPFRNFTDFVSRIQHKDLNKKSLESLARSGALDSLGVERNTILFNMDETLKFANAVRKITRDNHMSLFGTSVSENSLKLKLAPPAPPQQKLMWEKELLGIYVSDHPLNHVADQLTKYKTIPINEVLANHAEGENPVRRIGGVITKIQKIITKRGQPMLFVKIEDFTGSIEVVVFSDILTKTIAAWKENGAVIVGGRLSTRDDEPKFVCEEAKAL